MAKKALKKLQIPDLHEPEIVAREKFFQLFRKEAIELGLAVAPEKSPFYFTHWVKLPFPSTTLLTFDYPNRPDCSFFDEPGYIFHATAHLVTEPKVEGGGKSSSLKHQELHFVFQSDGTVQRRQDVLLRLTDIADRSCPEIFQFPTWEAGVAAILRLLHAQLSTIRDKVEWCYQRAAQRRGLYRFASPAPFPSSPPPTAPDTPS